jgi:four helix bundle protein
MTSPISSFRELRVYREACDLDFEIFVTSKAFPREEMYSLTDQVRRSSRSIGANIAEAWAKRRYPAHFVSKLTDADAELQETRHWLDRANAYRYLPDEKRIALEQCCDRIGGMLGNMILHPESFTHPPS